MIRGFIPATLALWAGAVAAEDVPFYGGAVVLSVPEGMTVGREFGQGDAVYAVELNSPTLETMWTQAGRIDELSDMDRMEAGFGLTFPSTDCADFGATALVVPTKCKTSIGMSLLVVDRTTADSGELLGNQLGLLAADVDALWSDAAFDDMLTAFCDNPLHAHRVEVSRTQDSVICVSDRPALAPHFLSFRLIVNDNYAVVMFAQNVFAETDVILTYGVDPFLDLIESAENIEPTLFALSQDYIAANGYDATHLIDVLSAVRVQ